MEDIDTDNGVMEYLFTRRFVGFSANSILGSLLQSIQKEIDYIWIKKNYSFNILNNYKPLISSALVQLNLKSSCLIVEMVTWFWKTISDLKHDFIGF